MHKYLSIILPILSVLVIYYSFTKNNENEDNKILITDFNGEEVILANWTKDKYIRSGYYNGYCYVFPIEHKVTYQYVNTEYKKLLSKESMIGLKETSKDCFFKVRALYYDKPNELKPMKF